MLSAFRKYTKVFIWVVIVAFVGTIIFAWGMDVTRSKTQKNFIGNIDGNDIEFRAYQSYYERIYQDEQAKTQTELDLATLNTIRQNAWDNLVSDFLLNREIRARNITVTNEEFYAFLKYQPPQEIQQSEAFLSAEGNFDYQKYLAALADPRYSNFWSQIEYVYRPELRKLKLQDQIVSTVRVDENEIRDYFLDTNERSTVVVIDAPISKFANPNLELTDEEVAAYFDSHKDDYETGERASLDYVMFSKDPTEKDWELIELEAAEIKRMLDTDDDFAELAIAFSEDNSAQGGGDLGWFGKGRMVKEFDSAAFALEIGVVSEPVRTQYGWHIIKVEEKKKDKDGEQVKARHILLKIKASAETLDQAFANASGLQEAITGSDLAGTAEELGYEVKNTGFFSEDTEIPEIGFERNINKFAFSNEVGVVSPIFETDAMVVIVKIAEISPAGVSPFEEVKDRVRRNLIDYLAKQKCQQDIAKIWARIEEGVAFDKAASELEYETFTTRPITRRDYIRGIGGDPKLIGSVFSLNEPDDLSGPVEYLKGWCILKLVERQGADLTQYGEIRDSLVQVVLGQKQRDLFNAWYIDMIASAEIEDYIDEYFTNR